MTSPGAPTPPDGGRPKRRRYHQGACLICGRFLKPYGDGWHDSVHTACKEPSR